MISALFAMGKYADILQAVRAEDVAAIRKMLSRASQRGSLSSKYTTVTRVCMQIIIVLPTLVVVVVVVVVVYLSEM